MITKKELENTLNKLDNPVDRFMVAGLFYGLNGKSDYKEQFLNIKSDSVDFENSTITLPDGTIVVMDSLLKKITQEAVKQKIYVKMGNQGRTNEDYEFNLNNPYIIKVKPTKKNNNGLSPLTFEGLRTRLKRISEFLGTKEKLTSNYLKQSGIFHMLQAENRTWRTCDAERFLAENNTSIRRNMLLEMLKEINGGT